MILETERLILKRIKITDAPFYFKLFNDSDWIQFISDKGLNSVEQTKLYLRDEFIPKICINGFGFFTVFERKTNIPIGTSTVLQRKKLDFPDIGYGFLPIGRGKGYALEATQRIMDYAKEHLQQQKVYAFTKPNNERSKKLLTKLGFHYKGLQPIFSENGDSVFEFIF